MTEECLFAIGSLCVIEENKEAFAALGLEALLVRAVTRHVAVEEVCEQGSFVIAKLCESPHTLAGSSGVSSSNSNSSSSSNSQVMMSNLAAAGACKLLPALMIKYHDNLRIAEHCCHALALLASSEAISRKLGSASASAAVIAVMESHLSDAHILALALRSIAQLNESESAGNLSNLRNDGVCAAVVKALHANVDSSPEITKLSLDVITTLAADEGCKLKFLQESVLGDALVKSLSLLAADKDIVLSGLSAVSSLCGGLVDMNKERAATAAPGTSPGSAEDHISNQVTEGRANDGALNNVSDSSLLLNAKLGDCGVCEAVVALLIRHKDQRDVCIAACAAIGSLAEFSENRRQMFACYEALLEMISTNKELAAVVRAACLALGSVAKDDSSGRSQDILGSLGVCELLVELLTKYSDSSDMCASISRAVTAVVYSHQGNKTKLLQADCMTLLQNSLIRHMDTEESTRYAVCAIAELTIDNKSDDILTRDASETCALVVHAMRRYLASAKLVQAGCMAIVALKHMNRFLGQASACELVVTVLIRYANSEVVVQWALRAVGSLSAAADNRLAFKETNLCDMICASLHTHVGSESILAVMLMRQTSSVLVAQYGCDAIYHLSRHQTDAAYFQTKFTQSNACEIVAKTFLKYTEIDVVACACLRAMVVLTKGSVGNAAKFGTLGICGSVVECLRNFPSSSDVRSLFEFICVYSICSNYFASCVLLQVAKWGCRCISVLAEDNQHNIAKFIASGVCESVPAAMQGHQMNVGVAGAGADAIATIVDSAGGDLGFASRFGRSGTLRMIYFVISISYVVVFFCIL